PYFAIFFLSACAQASDCFREEVFCAALATDTQGLNDFGLNQDTWAGLQQAQADGIVQRIEYIESVDARDYEKNIAYFADLGFDVIFTVGAAMADETLRAAGLYPDSVFVGVNQSARESRANLVSVTFPEDQMGFLAGALAARLSKTQAVCAVCETSGVASQWRYCEGFRAGVGFFNAEKGANVKPLILYREDGDREKIFVDEAWGANAAASLIQRGADVLFAAGGATGQGALRAALEAGVKVIGTERDQRAALRDSGTGVVASILGDARFEVQQTLLLAAEGSVPQARLGPIRYILSDRAPSESLTLEMDSLLLKLWHGEVKTNVTLSKP
ncbi:MAG: BMP family ABC transporter substrate-binding protein, partial [Chloroflexi bacterium]|nr:BMP family ABC transporter substrate-binding protein [Chloroflexota bacterium]